MPPSIRRDQLDPCGVYFGTTGGQVYVSADSGDTWMPIVENLPAVVSVTEALPDPRFPGFKGIMAAKKKPVEVLSLADLGIDADDLSTSRSIMLAIDARPPRGGGVKITDDDGDAAVRLSAFLAENHLI